MNMSRGLVVKVVPSMDTDAHTPNERYPWSEWTDGNSHILTHGTDFSCEPQSFRYAAYQYARRNGFKVRTVRIRNGVERVKVTFSRLPE